MALALALRLDFVRLQLTMGTSALGMRFYNGEAVPKEYQGNVIVARHGSHPPTRVGYDVVRVVMNGNKAERMEPFLTGFLQGMK